MRILVANKFWYHRGGLERVMFDEISWLEAAGHEVGHFSTCHPDNEPSAWSDYFAPHLDLGSHASLTKREQVTAACRTFWSFEAERRFVRLLADYRPDVVHAHGIHRQISPSILSAARRAGVPVVQTLHDCHPVCASGDLMYAGNEACDPPRCGRINVLPCWLAGCVDHSKARSVLAGTELLWRRWVVSYHKLIDTFIAPSQYLATRVARGGIPLAKLRVLPNAVRMPADLRMEDEGEAFVYAGRLSPEKGLETLMQAVNLAQVPLLVAGSGPLSDQLRDHASSLVRFLGQLKADAVDDLIARCRAAVVPSLGPENAPLAVLEAMALGKPVVGTRMGGIPEQIRDGVDGILVHAGDVVELAAALRILHEEPDLALRLGRSARERAAKLFSPDAHLKGLLAVYSAAMRRPEQKAERSRET